MKTKRTLNSGQPGTNKLVQKYGDSFVCVRYKYDERTNRRQKTVELILEDTSWFPKITKKNASEKVFLRIEYGEIELRIKVKEAGGIWDKKKQLWLIERIKAYKLNLKDRIVSL